MRILSLAAAAAMLFAAAPAVAQNGEAGRPPASAAATDAGFDVRKSLALRYLEAAGIQNTMMTALRSMVQAIPVDDVPASRRDAVRALAADAMEEILPEYFDHLAGIYAAEFSHEELRALVDFYESPVGQVIVRKSGMLAARTEELMNWLMPRYDAEIQRLRCERFGCEERPAPRIS